MFRVLTLAVLEKKAIFAAVLKLLEDRLHSA